MYQTFKVLANDPTIMLKHGDKVVNIVCTFKALANDLNTPVYQTILLKEKYSRIVSTLQPPTY